MNDRDAQDHLNRLVDGQTIRVTVASGRIFDGIYDGEKSSLEGGLYFETVNDGRELRAEWKKVDSIGFRSSRATAGHMMVPPEHPLAAPDDRLRPYTVRNPLPGYE